MSAASITRGSWLALTILAACGCTRPTGSVEAREVAASVAPPVDVPVVSKWDAERAACSRRLEELASSPELPGTPEMDRNRIEILGRARGEPMVFVREPDVSVFAPTTPFQAAAVRAFEHGPSGARVERLARALRADPHALRSILLREGYVYATDPLDALELSRLRLVDLFDEPSVFLHRGSAIREARRVQRRGGAAYVWAFGDDEGRDADLQFGDRLSATREALDAPLHRDLRALAASTGFDRARILLRSEHAVVAELRFGPTWVKAILESDGAALRIACREAPDDALRTVDAFVEGDAPRRRALAHLTDAVSAAVNEALRFDRPEGEKTAERDGQLRPVWYAAYLRGSGAFEFDGNSYPTRDADGRPWPPEVCVDFVLDSYERASGTWFRGAGEPPGRVRGHLDFDAHKIENRRGVLGFEKFAEKTPELFEVRHFQGEERIPFERRTAFFQFLLDHADELRPGDVLAIQGRKRDGLIHQHAILLEAIDPLTGFAYGLADQMKRPRRRTWEGIMAEAPARSLLYRARPTDEVLLASER